MNIYFGVVKYYINTKSSWLILFGDFIFGLSVVEIDFLTFLSLIALSVFPFSSVSVEALLLELSCLGLCPFENLRTQPSIIMQYPF
jgi:hypothetical protein